MDCEDRSSPSGAVRPLVGVLCCNEVLDRPVQTVATRFVRPLQMLSGAIVMLVPSVIDGADVNAIAARLDGLLLTGSRSHVAPERYGRESDAAPLDRDRDAVALLLADRMIERGRPVYGICRGMQEINVLFGGTLTGRLTPGVHHQGERPGDYARLFSHRHAITLKPGGQLSMWHPETARFDVNSVHFQGTERLGSGLVVEAVADDGLVEAISARPCGGEVIGVQWHPEWRTSGDPFSRRYFQHFGEAIRDAR